MDNPSSTKSFDHLRIPQTRLNKAFRLVAFALGLWGVSATSALAQLRTGRTERSFYQSERQTSQNSAKTTRVAKATTSSKAKRTKSSSKVVQASYRLQDDVDAPTPVESEPQALQPVPLDLHATTHTSSGCSDCDSGGCSSCGPSLAPAATAYCPPGCGPLLALWYRTKVRAEVPLYWRRDQGPPPLVTTSPSGTPANIAGELGQATTQTLLGGVLNEENTTGVRLTFSTCIGSGDNLGLMLRYWNAGDQDDTYSFDSNSNAILARPFFNTTVAGSFEQDTQLIAFPSEAVGNINVTTTSALDGLDITLKRLLYKDRFTRIDWTYGYQRVMLQEGLTISSDTTVTGNLLGLQGTAISVTDNFQTENEFNGVSYGIMSTRSVGAWKLETMFRLGLGNLRREVMINGSTTTTSGGASATDAQGLLARNTNNQTFTDDTFVAIPEVGINFAYLIRPGMHFNLGYNYMLVPKVAQAAQQIDNDLAVNLSNPITGQLDPALDFTERDYWINSLGLGFQIRY